MWYDSSTCTCKYTYINIIQRIWQEEGEEVLHYTLFAQFLGYMRICSIQKICFTWGRHDLSGLIKFSCLPRNWAINCLLLQTWLFSLGGKFRKNVGTQNMYHDVTTNTWYALEQCRETWLLDRQICLPPTCLFKTNHTSLFVKSVLWGMINENFSGNICLHLWSLVEAIL